MTGIFPSIKQSFTGPPPAAKVERQAEKQARHRQEALAFAKQNHQELSHKQHNHDAWHRRYGKHQPAEISRLNSAWVITTGSYISNAVELARQSKVRLLDSTELGKLILQLENGPGN